MKGEDVPKRSSKNAVQKVIEFPRDQDEEVQRFADGRSETFRAVVLHSLRRHMKYPPPPEPAPTEPLLHRLQLARQGTLGNYESQRECLPPPQFWGPGVHRHATAVTTNAHAPLDPR